MLPEPAYLQALVLGLVEGITEFLPVSSTGHLIVVGYWIGFTGERAKVFEVVIQLGAILAVVWQYRATFTAAAKGWRDDRAARRFLVSLGFGFLPVAVVGALAHGWIKAVLFSPQVVALALIAGGVAIIPVERWAAQRSTKAATRGDRVPPLIALGVGLVQTLALIPGVSRSAATILGGLALGLTREAATEFSFFLAVPVMLAATAFELTASLPLLTRGDAPVFALGLIAAYVSALVVIRALVTFVARHSFTVFAWYRIAAGLLVFLAFPTT